MYYKERYLNQICFIWVFMKVFVHIRILCFRYSVSGRKGLSYTTGVFLRCSWSPTTPFIQHGPCLHKFIVPCTNWRTRWWISSILSSVVLLSLHIRFCLNKPGYTLCLLLRSSHFIGVHLTVFLPLTQYLKHKILMWIRTLINTKF